MAQIEFEDKVAFRQSTLPEKNKVTADNMNEIKASVNALYDNTVAPDLESVLTEGNTTGANDIVVNIGQKITTESGEAGILFGYEAPINLPDLISIGDLLDPLSPPITGVYSRFTIANGESISETRNYGTGTRAEISTSDNRSEIKNRNETGDESTITVIPDEIVLSSTDGTNTSTETITTSSITSTIINGTSESTINQQLGQIESKVENVLSSTTIVQNTSNITVTSPEIWLFADTSGIEMSDASIDISSTILNYNGSEVARKNDTGWASYRDTTYTAGSPFTILDTVTSTLPNNAGTVINSELPEGVSSFYNSGTGKLTPQLDGDYNIFAIRFKAKNSATMGGYMDFGIDIGGALGVVFKETLIFPKGAGVEHDFTISCPGYSAATFVANGGLVKLTAGAGNLSIYDIEFQITRVHKKI